ncbi:MAG TPA: matrixin family metalloprotease, partial [Thermoanaerobaculia bacterium]|nr:matrixin family metalloprotease [Thermoanaerobaculia bacterium]
MTRKFLLLILLTLLAVLAATPASAYVFWQDCRGGVRWNNNDVTWRPSLVSFPSGGPWYQSIDASRVAWNSFTPGANYRINYIWDTNTSYSNTDGRNSILTPAVWPEDSGYLAVTYPRRSMCYAWPGPDANWVEMDIIFNGNKAWENSLNPVAPNFSPYNVALVAIHEHGHGFGLTHENDQPATMNATYPNAGPIGNPNYIHPHADDARGNRALYGTAATQRDVAAFKYRLRNP